MPDHALITELLVASFSSPSPALCLLLARNRVVVKMADGAEASTTPPTPEPQLTLPAVANLVNELHRRQGLTETLTSAHAQQIADMLTRIQAIEQHGGQDWKTGKVKLTFQTTERMAAIDVYASSRDFPKFARQLKIQMEIAHWFAALWFVQEGPKNQTVESSRRFAEQHNLSEIELAGFYRDLWNVLVTKMQGNGASIVNLQMERASSETDRRLRGPRAFHELYVEARGQMGDRKLELHRAVVQPPKLKEWSDVPSGIRAWEAKVEEYDVLTNTPLSEDTKLVTLQEMLPQTLEEKAISHPSYEDGYRAWRDHVTSLVARLSSRMPSRTTPSAAPRTSTTKTSPSGQAPTLDQLDGEHVPTPDLEYDDPDLWDSDEWDVYMYAMKGKAGGIKGKGKGSKGQRPPVTCWNCQEV